MDIRGRRVSCIFTWCVCIFPRLRQRRSESNEYTLSIREDVCTPPLAGITMMLPQSGQRPFFPPLSSGVRRVFPHSEQVNSMGTLLTPGRLSAISNKDGVLVGAFTIGRR